ncbi:MFS family permease [Pseudomonas hunanensis]|uniref:MFS family permease n=1 Tax=Pseudomonas hunanensis TaxID=1247546 RepID=A0ACC6K3E5_9PSED|nr:MFS transporter [Pseudomonas hunanensis]MDR6712931.1 MFS family permease [Pseudomonas hunanensis]
MTTLHSDTPLTHGAIRPQSAAVTSRRATVACALGNALEMYDFTIYSFFAVVIAKNFFPAQSPLASLLMSLTAFGVGFLMRPVGAMVIGRLADRKGRKAVLTLTIFLMTLGTALIAFAPTYQQAGVFGTVLLVIGRLTQGFSAGGEIGTASVLLMESASTSKRCASVSWQAASQGYAALVGAGLGLLLSSVMSTPDLEDWGWRIPFMIGLLIGPVGWYIRRCIPETLEQPAPSAPRPGTAKPHWRKVIDLRNTVLATGLMASATIGMYLFIFYMPSYLVSTLHYPQRSAMAIACVAAACLAIITPIAGRYADRHGLRKKLLAWTISLPVIAAWPALWLLSHSTDLYAAMLIVALLVLPGCVGSGAFFALIMEGFAKPQRALGTSVSYSFGVTLFGGFSPLIATWLTSTLDDPLAPAYYLLAGGVISLLCLKLFPENLGRA